MFPHLRSDVVQGRVYIDFISRAAASMIRLASPLTLSLSPSLFFYTLFNEDSSRCGFVTTHQPSLSERNVKIAIDREIPGSALIGFPVLIISIDDE